MIARLDIRCTGCDCMEVLRAMPAASLLRILQHWIEHHGHGEVSIAEIPNSGTEDGMVVVQSELDALNAYRERLFAFIGRDSYKNDCGQIEVRLPGFSADRHQMGDGTGKVWLQVRCEAAPQMERTHFYGGDTLGEAVTRAVDALEQWEGGR